MPTWLQVIISFIVIIFVIILTFVFIWFNKRFNRKNNTNVKNIKNINPEQYYSVLGEKLGYDYLKHNWDNISIDNKLKNIKWVNEKEEVFLPYDIYVETKNNQIWFDVKTTTNKNYLYWSDNERNQAIKWIKQDEQKHRYYILFIKRVYFDDKISNDNSVLLKSQPIFKIISFNEIIQIHTTDNKYIFN